MIIIKDKKDCSGCHACSNVCPKKCIQMLTDNEGFWYPQISKEDCVDCGICEKVCPIIHKWHPVKDQTTVAFAAFHQNEDIRLMSSSGGIFTLLAHAIIDQGGVVFGAAFSGDFKSVHHICVEDIDSVEKLRGSKYLQSEIGKAYEKAKEYLDNGRKVLFTGTPCQIGGLYSFLRKPYDGLYTQDIICHGVPSPMVWKKYVEHHERKSVSKTQQVFFRDKKSGWKTYAVFFKFLNNITFEKNFREDAFMRAFLSNICLRPSCYDCSFKGIERISDITLADFWGVQNICPEMDDDKGTSLVFIHSEKGIELYRQIEGEIRSVAQACDNVVRYNPSAVNSTPMHPKRADFMLNIQKNDFEHVVNKYTKKKLYHRVLARIKNSFRSIMEKIRR